MGTKENGYKGEWVQKGIGNKKESGKTWGIGQKMLKSKNGKWTKRRMGTKENGKK
jgi:hypothetical protein